VLGVSRRRSPSSADEPHIELGEKWLDALEMLIGGPECGVAGVGGNGDLDVGERQYLAAVSKRSGKQSHALPGLAVELDTREAREGGRQVGAVFQARAGDQLGDDRTADENLAVVERTRQFAGEFLSAGAQVSDPHRGVGQDHCLRGAVPRSELAGDIVDLQGPGKLLEAIDRVVGEEHLDRVLDGVGLRAARKPRQQSRHQVVVDVKRRSYGTSLADPLFTANCGPGPRTVSLVIPYPMAMTLRLTDDETDALRRRAQREGRSMQDVARSAIREYVDRTSRRELLDEILDEELPRYAEALRRLGE
jgi:predicted transcriptional regulator